MKEYSFLLFIQVKRLDAHVHYLIKLCTVRLQFQVFLILSYNVYTKEAQLTKTSTINFNMIVKKFAV